MSPFKSNPSGISPLHFLCIYTQGNNPTGHFTILEPYKSTNQQTLCITKTLIDKFAGSEIAKYPLGKTYVSEEVECSYWRVGGGGVAKIYIANSRNCHFRIFSPSSSSLPFLPTQHFSKTNTITTTSKGKSECLTTFLSLSFPAIFPCSESACS